MVQIGRQMKMALSIASLGYHPACWRLPSMPADGTMQFQHYVNVLKTAERGKIDMIFLADVAASREIGPSNPTREPSTSCCAARTVDAARGAGSSDKQYWPRCNSIHHIQRTIQFSSAPCHTRPYQWRSYRMECRDRVQRRRSAELWFQRGS